MKSGRRSTGFGPQLSVFFCGPVLTTVSVLWFAEPPWPRWQWNCLLCTEQGILTYSSSRPPRSRTRDRATTRSGLGDGLGFDPRVGVAVNLAYSFIGSVVFIAALLRSTRRVRR